MGETWKKLNEKARGYREQIAKLENDLAVLKGKTPAKESDFSNKMDFIQAKFPPYAGEVY